MFPLHIYKTYSTTLIELHLHQIAAHKHNNQQFIFSVELISMTNYNINYILTVLLCYEPTKSNL